MNKKIVYKNGRMNKIIIWIYCNKMQVQLLLIKKLYDNKRDRNNKQ